MASTRILRRLLRLLERPDGRLDHLVSEGSSRVITSSELSRDALDALFSHQACALHIQGFYPAALCAELAAEALQLPRRNWSVSHAQREQEESAVDTLDLPLNVAIGEGKIESYYQQALNTTRRWRGGATCRLSPLDKLRLELDEVWEDGCGVGKDPKSRRSYAAGMVRVMSPKYHYDPSAWKRGFIHVDELDILRQDRGLFSANIYLQQAPAGGELNIWPISVRSRVDFYRHARLLSLLLVQDEAAQKELFDSLPPPITISPKAGDLVIICTQHPHAVKGPLYGGDRVSVQSFMQFVRGQPLRLES